MGGAMGTDRASRKLEEFRKRRVKTETLVACGPPSQRDPALLRVNAGYLSCWFFSGFALSWCLLLSGVREKIVHLTRSCEPVLNLECGQSLELGDVVGDAYRLDRACLRRDKHVVRTNRR